MSADLGDFARAKATEIYDLSELCLMAHSIRAVEKSIGNGYGIFIREREFFARKVGHPALAYIKGHKTDIVVDRDLSKERKRRSIAHELGHILIAHEEYSRNGRLTRRADRLAEDAASLFEVTLCKKHNQFYKTKEKLDGCKFPSLEDNE